VRNGNPFRISFQSRELEINFSSEVSEFGSTSGSIISLYDDLTELNECTTLGHELAHKVYEIVYQAESDDSVLMTEGQFCWGVEEILRCLMENNIIEYKGFGNE